MPRVVVVGAGAAGTMAAIFAASAGAETILLERTSDGGRKILISGGGRCNILPSRVDVGRFVTASSRNTLRKILKSWPLEDQIGFFERDLDLPLVEEPETAKLFPRSQRARDVRDRLGAHARRAGVTILGNVTMTGLVLSGGRWRVLADGADFDADAVVLATGGLSVPTTGSDGSGLEIAGKLGHVVHRTYPALTPLIAEAIATGEAPLAHLAGVSLHVSLTARAAAGDATATGGFLFTHRGYSGPSVLDVSHVAVQSVETDAPARIVVRWSNATDDEWEARLRAQGSRTVSAVLGVELPQRLAESLMTCAGVSGACQLSQLGRQQRLTLIDALLRFPLSWTGHEGYKKAEVTGGGVSLAEVDPATLESRRHRGLFLCGEMLDAFGPIGGYNFLWAWATGRAAGLGAGKFRQ